MDGKMTLDTLSMQIALSLRFFMTSLGSLFLLRLVEEEQETFASLLPPSKLPSVPNICTYIQYNTHYSSSSFSSFLNRDQQKAINISKPLFLEYAIIVICVRVALVSKRSNFVYRNLQWVHLVSICFFYKMIKIDVNFFFFCSA